MEFIDKTRDAAANATIDPFLRQTIGQPTCNANSIYEEWRRFNNGHDKNRMIDDVLLVEQTHRCCYCMKRIEDHDDKNATIEHIIPQSVQTQDELDEYFKLQYDGVNDDNICLTEDYLNGEATKPSAYPHRLAYHNFAIACEKCNGLRGNKYIEPIFLKNSIREEVQYDNAGVAVWHNDPVYSDPNALNLPMLDKIDLNRPLLKAIRATWFYAKRNNISLKILSSDNRDEIIYNAFGAALDANPNMNAREFGVFVDLLKNEFWNILLKYDYFGGDLTAE